MIRHLRANIAYALFLGLCLAFLDMIISLLRHPPDLDHFGSILPPLAVSALFLSVLIFLGTFVWQALSGLIQKKSTQMQVKVLMFSCISFILLRIFNLIRFSSLTLTLGIAALIILIMSGVFTWILTVSIKGFMPRLQQILTQNKFRNLILAVFSEALFAVWCLQYPLQHTAGWIRWPLLLLFTAVLLLSALLMSRKPVHVSSTGVSIGLIIVSLGLGLNFHRNSFVVKNNLTIRGQAALKRIFLISIDTLRMDCLSCYQETGVQTPNIDALAHEGILFENAYSAAPWTKPSVTSILTGLPHVVHKVNDHQTCLSDSFDTISEILTQSGYRTLGIGDNLMLTSTFNYDQGFQEYNFYPKGHENFGYALGVKLYYDKLAPRFFQQKANTAQLTDMAIKSVQENSGVPVFMWLHINDPHTPLTPPAAYIENDTALADIPADFKNHIKSMNALQKIKNPREQKWVKALYRAEIKYVDANLGRFFQFLKEKDLYDSSLIILLSDHGQELWDHGKFGHAHTLFNELIHIPLIVKLPGRMEVQSGLRIHEPVSALSIMPTLIELSGSVTRQPVSIYPSLAEFWDDASRPESQPIFSSGTFFQGPKESVIDSGYKFIRDLSDNRMDSLFYLPDDPGETRSLIHALPAKSEWMRVLDDSVRQASLTLGVHFQSLRNPETVQSKRALEKLRSLGYIK